MLTGSTVAPDRPLKLFERDDLDLAYPLVANAMGSAKNHERGRFFLEVALNHDMPFTSAQGCKPLTQRLPALGVFFVFCKLDFLAGSVIDQPVLPLALAVGPEWRVQRAIGGG